MSVTYSIYETPKPNDRKGKTLTHARVHPQGTKRMDEVCSFINDVSSLTSADVKGVLEALFNYVTTQLKAGYNVELENFGHFSISLRSRQEVDEKGNEVETVEVDGVNFRCSPRLKKAVQFAPLSKVKKRGPAFPDVDKRKSRMLAYIEENGSINISRYAALNDCTYYCAQNDIKAFTEEGIITPIGSRTHRIYMLPTE